MKVATTQMKCSWDREQNVANAERLVRDAARQGARIILIQELFETPYFCIDEDHKFYDLATPVAQNPTVQRMAELARELDVVLPVSVFERANNALFNSLVMIDADGTIMGSYRKTHIPDVPGYSEKYYFSPGDKGLPVWNTRYGKIGALICWDQWFPEPARILALRGAEILLYPSAIGSDLNSTDTIALRHWQNVMRGHAAANILPVIASNRIGTEEGKNGSIRFYGASFVADHMGELLGECDQENESVLVCDVDLEVSNKYRIFFNLFRDRRPEIYGDILTLDGIGSSYTTA
ncbi:MAG: N-carbamoylputrescine amidase [Gammaproteobacteria bacterium]|nr:N-carbamoylputrescine amidase [Gammaproteobacteria bacterium]